MEYNGKKDTLEIFNDTWKVNHHGVLPSEKKINKNGIIQKDTYKVNNNQSKPIGYQGFNKRSGLNG